jgi:hypothetical protein
MDGENYKLGSGADLGKLRLVVIFMEHILESPES